MAKIPRIMTVVATSMLVYGCSETSTESSTSASCDGIAAPCIVVEASATAQTDLLTPLQDPEDGTTIVLGEGTYNLTTEILIVGGKNISILGQGKDKTILSFSGQSAGEGSNGVVADAVDGVVFQGFAIENPAGDGLVARKSKNVIFRDIRVEWTDGPDEDNGLYAIYPVGCENVLVEHTVARGGSDAGIYIGESKNVIARYNEAYENVSGLQIENTFDSEVYDNYVHDNSLGIFIFDLPNKDTQKNAGRHLIHNNYSVRNNLKNFGNPNQIAGAVPSGTGFLVMAVDSVEVRNNIVEDNQAISFAVVNFDIAQQEYVDEEYSPYPKNVYVHANEITGGGDGVGDLIANGGSSAALETLVLLSDYYSAKDKVADLVYDGLTTGTVPNGTPENPLNICFSGNTYKASASAGGNDATWDNLRVDLLLDDEGKLDTGKIDRDLVESDPAYLDCKGATQKPVKLAIAE